MQTLSCFIRSLRQLNQFLLARCSSAGGKTVAATGAAAKDTNYAKNKKPWDL
jgi:hypothetical protein